MKGEQQMDCTPALSTSQAEAKPFGAILCPVKLCDKSLKNGKTSRLLKHFKRRHPDKILFQCIHCTSFLTVKRKCMLKHQRRCASHDPTAAHHFKCYSPVQRTREDFESFESFPQFICMMCNCPFEDIHKFNIHIEEVHLDQSKSVDSDVTLHPVSASIDDKKKIRDKEQSPRGGVKRQTDRDASGKKEPLSWINTGFELEESTPPTEINVYSQSKKLYPCHECGKLFTRQRSVTYHMVVHTGERNFHCRRCPYEAKRRGDLTAHEQKTHLKERPYTCNVCNKTFGFKSNLTKHEQSHSNPVVYQCNINQCAKKYHYKSSLDLHKKKQHKINWK